MSDKDKRDRALQRRVRERQDKTGESYQAAWHHVTRDEHSDTDAKAKTDNDHPPTRWETRVVIPLSLPRNIQAILPQQKVRIASENKHGAIDLTRLIISSAGTMGGAADWVVNDLEINGRSQLALKDLTGGVFGSRGIIANQRSKTALSMEGLDTLEHGHELAIVVTYIGENPAGCPFYGSVLGSPAPQRPTVIPFASKEPLLPQVKTTISAHIQNAPFRLDRFEIKDNDTILGPYNWRIEDIRINGETQFAQPGTISGNVFASYEIDSFIKFTTCEAGNKIEIDVVCIGKEAHAFVAELKGTVVRDDYEVPPPDLHVFVETSGRGGEEVIATCNWRFPPDTKLT